MEKNLKIYIYSLNHLAVYLTLTRHCKSTIFQLLKIVQKQKIYMETENRLEITQGREKTGIASEWGDFPAGPVVKTLPSNVGTWVQSLVREVRSHMLWLMAKIFLKLRKKQ